MQDNRMETNKVYVSGKIISDFQTAFKRCNTSYYMADMAVRRLSSQVDCIPVVFNDRLINTSNDYKGQYISVAGQYISYDFNESGRKRVKLYVMAEEVELGEAEDKDVDDNYIFLDGYVCKKPVLRRTPNGRSITDLFVAVNNSGKKAYYFPCICWGKIAYSAASLSLGAHVRIIGRIQSREYSKQLNEHTVEQRIAYEVSVKNLM